MSVETANRFVIGIFRKKAAADHCFDALVERGFPVEEITLIMSDETRKTYIGIDDGRKWDSPDPCRDLVGIPVGKHSIQGIGVGGVIGTAIGATIAAFVAGPLAAAALAAGGAGALTGGLMGGLIGLGIPEQDVVVYNDAVSKGGVVMSIAHSDSEELETIAKIMHEHCGEQVCHC